MIITDKECEAISAEINRAADRLTELGCDCVRLISTASASRGRTVTFNTGRGNYFAQVGVVGGWLKEQQDIALANEIGYQGPPGEPGEDWKGAE